MPFTEFVNRIENQPKEAKECLCSVCSADICEKSYYNGYLQIACDECIDQYIIDNTYEDTLLIYLTSYPELKQEFESMDYSLQAFVFEDLFHFREWWLNENKIDYKEVNY